MIAVQCTCGFKLVTGDQNAGLTIKCPECLCPLQVQGATVPSASQLSGSGHSVSARQPAATSAPSSGKTRRTPVEDQLALHPSSRTEVSSSRKSATASSSRPPALPQTNGRKQPAGKPKAHQAADNADSDVDEVDLEISQFNSRRTQKKQAAPTLPPAKRLSSKVAGASKKSSGSPQAAPPPKALWIGIALLAVLGITAAGVVLGPMLTRRLATAARAPKQAPAVEFAHFQHEHIPSITCHVPQGWDLKTGGGTGNTPPYVVVEKGSARISFRRSESGTSIGDIARSGGSGGQPMSLEDAPAGMVHRFLEEKFAQDIGGYKETGPAKGILTPIGEGRVSEFRGSSMMSSVAGYRITVLGTDTYQILLQCPASQLAQYQKTFERFIELIGQSTTIRPMERLDENGRVIVAGQPPAAPNQAPANEVDAEDE
jgi:hypothetical protein